MKSPLALILAQRLWQGGAGLVTVLILTHTLTIDAQGWYYSFLSIAALYTLFDLGLSLVLVQTAAHGSVTLRWTAEGRFEGEDSDRFSTLIAFAARHYALLALGFIGLVLPGGWLFFNASPSPHPDWQPAWLALIAATSAALLVIPFLALVEGSGEIAGVAATRLIQSVVGSLAAWTVLLLNGGLWATAMPALAAAICGGVWIVLRRPGLTTALRANPHLVDWKNEIWPLQWRLGISWLSGYLLTQIHTLVLFSADGAVAAGQIGLSMSIVNVLGIVAQSFIARNVPAMARAAARRDWPEMDRLFRRDFFLSCILFVVGGAAVICVAIGLSSSSYAARILSPLPFSGLVLALFLGHIHGLLAAQLRSYRREPLIWVALSSAIVTLAAAPIAARIAGTEGVIIVMLGVQIVIVLPLSVALFILRNLQWRAF